MRRLIQWVVVLALLGGIVWAAAVPGMDWWRKRSRPTYLTAEVTRGRVETAVNSTGTVKAERTISVGAFVSGPITDVHVDYNSEVKKGMLLAEIDPKLFKAAVSRDQAAISRDKAALKTQQSELARFQALLRQAKNNEKRGRELMKINKDYLSGTELDQLIANRESLEAQVQLARAGIEQAEANIEHAKANLENSNANLGYTKIKWEGEKPGIVIERKVEKGQTVASGFQTPEMFIVGIEMKKTMHIIASVDEADIGLIKESKKKERPVTFTVDAYPQKVFKARKIHQIRMNSTTTQNVVTYPVVIETDNPDLELFPGMTANITFQLEVKENVVRIPTSALRYVPQVRLVRAEDRKFLEGTAMPERNDSGVKLSASEKVELAKNRFKRIVWVQEETGLRAVHVNLGLLDNQNAELLSGDLQEGDKLVTGTETPVGGGP